MSKWFARTVVASALLAGSAHAACPTWPYTLSNGLTADASQIMGDFNSVITCFAPIAGPTFTGYVGIGTTSPVTPLNVNGRIFASSTTNNAGVYITGSDGTYGSVQATNAANNATVNLVLQQYGGNLAVSTPTPTSGYVFWVAGPAGGANAWNTTSDARLKKNVVEISDALAMVERLRGVRFQWRPADERPIGKDLKLDLDRPQLGFIAQEVEAVAPEAVTKPKLASDPYTMSADTLVPVLVEAIKQQQAEIETLRADVAKLKTAK